MFLSLINRLNIRTRIIFIAFNCFNVYFNILYYNLIMVRELSYDLG